jgi:hypothetical protein
MMQRSMRPVEEPLIESALLAWRLAPRLCRKDPVTGETCWWSHGLWQFLRLTGLGSTAAHRAGFYRHAIRDLRGNGNAPRILVSGTADYAMLAQVIAAFDGSGVKAEITVLDICETPLHLNRWYAKRIGQPVDTVCRDILHYEADRPFDLVCADSFLGRFPHARWPALARKWHSLLRPGGLVVTASRLRNGNAPATIGFPATRAKALRDAVLDLAEKKRHQLHIEPEDLARCADLYASRHVNHAVRSVDDVRIPFEAAGFDLTEMTVTPSDLGQAEGIESPSVPSDTRFLKMVARRR